jgi:hypothetical protein
VKEVRERRTIPNPIPREDPLSVPPRVEVDPSPRSEYDFKAQHGNTSVSARGSAALVVVAFFAAGAGSYLVGRYLTPLSGGEKVLKDEFAALEAKTVRERAAQQRELEAAKLEVRALRDQLKAQNATNEYNVQLIAASLRKTGIKLEWDDGTPVPEIDLHPAPLRVGKAPPIQPMAALKRAPLP